MLVHNCPISTDLSRFLVATHEAQENVLLYFIHTVKYVDNWGIVFLVNALMFHKVSRGFNKHQWPTKCTTFLRAVGYFNNFEYWHLFIACKNWLCSYETWMMAIFSFLNEKHILLYSIQSSESRHTGSCALAVFLLVLFFFWNAQ